MMAYVSSWCDHARDWSLALYLVQPVAQAAHGYIRYLDQVRLQIEHKK
jgi:hypothetical protein